jgi:signal transduction histidine kinase
MSEKIKVLIAEDDYLIAEEVVRIVKKIGFHIVGVAPNGIKAVDLAQKQKPDIVLMDIKMPRLDGIEAARRISEADDSIAIILLTAHESRDLIEKASETGIAAYLTKPPKAEEIERAVHIALSRQRDLVQSRKLIQELEEHKRQLDELNRTKDKFLSIIAHDLRNPVSSLYSFTEYLHTHSSKISSEKITTYIDAIHSTSKSLFDLLDDLLLWGSLQSGRNKLQPANYHLYEIIQPVTELLKATAARKKITLEDQTQPMEGIYADRYMIQTVIRNLVGNALKFTDENGTVIICSERINENVRITVADNGQGINKEILEQLFKIDHQYSTPGTHGEKGTGLGLALCKEMVEQNQGKIWVESEEGVGSRFIFELPCMKPELQST